MGEGEPTAEEFLREFLSDEPHAADGELRPLRHEPAAKPCGPLGIDCAP